MTAQVMFAGNAVADSEIRWTPKGTAVASFRVAVNERVKNDQGEWVDGDTTYYNVAAWDSMAEPVAEQVKKGTKVLVMGRLKARDYETKEGNIRTSLDVKADEVGISTGYRKAQPQSAAAAATDSWDAPF